MSLKNIVIIIIIIVIILIVIYARISGSCKLNKQYPCSKDFCLLKILKLNLQSKLKKEILEKIVYNKEIIKRVEINMYPETIGQCALPNKRGGTVSTDKMIKYLPSVIDFYKNTLCEFISNKLNLKLYTTSMDLPTTCALLVYEKEGDWINWHYDYNYYKGRFFTVLIPITNSLTCTKFQFINPENNIEDIDLTEDKCIVFEGNYLYHKASKLCENQKRVILSCQFVTDPNISFINKIRLKLKDFAYTGKIQ
jgi:hypothetical protein